MATIHHAVETMVDKLIDDMRGDTPLNAEEQALITTAIAKLSDSTRLEQAVVAVAEGHIHEAKAILASATEATEAASNTLVESAEHLAVLPDVQDELRTNHTDIKNELSQQITALPSLLGAPQHRYGTPHFTLDFYDNTCVELHKVHPTNPHGSSVYNSYGAVNAISLVDYTTKQFYAYWDPGSQVSSNNPAILLNINEKGEVSKVSRSSLLVNSAGVDSMMLLRLDNGEVSVAAFDVKNKRISVYEHMSFELKLTQDVDYFRVYQHPENHKIYIVNSGFLYALQGEDNEWKRQSESFSSEQKFISWANENNLTNISSLSIKPKNNSNYYISNYVGYGASYAYLPISYPHVYLNLSYTDKGLTRVNSLKNQNISCYSTDTTNGSTTIFVREYRGLIELNTHDGRFAVNLSSRTPNNGYTTSSSHNANHYPHLITYSPIHRALIVEQGFYFYYSGSSGIGHTRNRVYFA